jgi:hypothetical protein
MKINKQIKNYLEQIYYNHKNATSFSNIETIYKYIKGDGKINIDKETLKHWLLEQEVYSTHIAKKRPKHWSSIIIPYAKYMIDFDSAFLSSGDKIKNVVIGIRFIH